MRPCSRRDGVPGDVELYVNLLGTVSPSLTLVKSTFLGLGRRVNGKASNRSGGRRLEKRAAVRGRHGQRRARRRGARRQRQLVGERREEERRWRSRRDLLEIGSQRVLSALRMAVQRRCASPRSRRSIFAIPVARRTGVPPARCARRRRVVCVGTAAGCAGGLKSPPPSPPPPPPPHRLEQTVTHGTSGLVRLRRAARGQHDRRAAGAHRRARRRGLRGRDLVRWFAVPAAAPRRSLRLLPRREGARRTPRWSRLCAARRAPPPGRAAAARHADHAVERRRWRRSRSRAGAGRSSRRCSRAPASCRPRWWGRRRT